MYPWTGLALAADAALTLVFYNVNRNISKTAQKAEDCPEVELTPALVERLREAPGRSIAYCCVTGLVQAQASALESHYRNEKGVIQKLTLIEHRTTRKQGFWADCKKVVRDATNFAPFKLVGCRPEDPEVIVCEPFSAFYLMDDLRTTYDKFEPTQTSVLERGVDRMFGDVSKGYQETEHMLSIGTPLVGLGKLVLEKQALRIMPPEPEDGYYILTRLTREEVVKVLRYRARTARVLAWITGLIGAGCLTYFAYKACKRWWTDYQMRKLMSEFRQKRAGGEDEEIDEDSASTNCVICLSRPRNVVTLDCGHVSMCDECAELLPDPRVCPICRQPVIRVTPVYVS